RDDERTADRDDGHAPAEAALERAPHRGEIDHEHVRVRGKRRHPAQEIEPAGRESGEGTERRAGVEDRAARVAEVARELGPGEHDRDDEEPAGEEQPRAQRPGAHGHLGRQREDAGAHHRVQHDQRGAQQADAADQRQASDPVVTHRFPPTESRASKSHLQARSQPLAWRVAANTSIMRVPHGRESTMHSRLWLLVAVLACAACDVNARKEPMPEKKPHKLEIHGDVRVDDYYWLRERDNPDVIAYLEAENAHADSVMATYADLHETVLAELKSRIKPEDE